jgi:hypothetical protein
MEANHNDIHPGFIVNFMSAAPNSQLGFKKGSAYNWKVNYVTSGETY